MGVKYNNGSGYLVMAQLASRAAVAAVIPMKEDADKLSKELGNTSFVKQSGKAPRGERDSVPKTTNEEFADGDKLFRESCDAAGIPATPRQASKWLNGRGLAFSHRRGSAQ